MSSKAVTIALLGFVPLTAGHAQQFDPNGYASWNLPQWVNSAAANAHLWESYELFLRLNPFYQRGDFDGDGQLDIAIQISHKQTHKRGIAIIHRADSSVHIVGAGQRLGNGGDDFAWLWVWRVDPPDPRHYRGESLYVEKPESASGWIVWNGQTYTWIQGSD